MMIIVGLCLPGHTQLLGSWLLSSKNVANYEINWKGSQMKWNRLQPGQMLWTMEGKEPPLVCLECSLGG